MNKGDEFIKYKGRSYARIDVSGDGKTILTDEVIIAKKTLYYWYEY